MRNLVCIILIVLTMTGCSNTKTSIESNNQNQIDSLKQNLVPILNGVWVLTDYINQIEKTKSPLKAADKLNGVVTMIIDSKIKSDSIYVGATLNNHEGYNFTTYFLIGQNPNNLKTNLPDFDENSNYYELGYETISNETFLLLYHYNKSNKLIEKIRFSKVLDKQKHDDDVSLGLEYIVNKKLISGSYQLLDSLNQNVNIHLNSDGSVTGFKKFKTFSVVTDFIESDPDNNLSDEICFYLSKENKSCFDFKIKSDTLILTQENLQYKLVKR